jgi:hypothetical protein
MKRILKIRKWFDLGQSECEIWACQNLNKSPRRSGQNSTLKSINISISFGDFLFWFEEFAKITGAQIYSVHGDFKDL